MSTHDSEKTKKSKEQKICNSESDNSDNESDIEDASQISKDVDKKVITSEFKDYVIKYTKIDDLIRKKNEDLKELKQQKKPCEEFIIKFLQKQEIEFVHPTPGQTLMKKETESKSALKADIIKEAILEGLMVNKIVTKEDIEKANKMADEMLEMVEKRRVVTKKTTIVRTFEKEKKPKQPRKPAVKKMLKNVKV